MDSRKGMWNRMARWLTLGMAVVALLLLSIQMFSRDDQTPRDILIKKNPVANSASVLDKARSNFEDNCIPCHGAEGKGDGPLSSSLNTKPKNLTNAKEIAELTDGEIFWTISKGRNPMPAFDQKLTDEERWGLVHLVRGISHTNPKAAHRNP